MSTEVSHWCSDHGISFDERCMCCKEAKALNTMAKMQELNRRFRVMGVSIHEATIDDHKQEVDRLNQEIEALTHKGRQGELEQTNVKFAQENEDLKNQLEVQIGLALAWKEKCEKAQKEVKNWRWVPETLAGQKFADENEAHSYLRKELRAYRVEIANKDEENRELAKQLSLLNKAAREAFDIVDNDSQDGALAYKVLEKVLCPKEKE